MIRVNQTVQVPLEELTFSASRSGGPGGQNVNKVNTRVTLRFDVAGSPSLSPDDKQMLLARLAGRVTRQGALRFVSQKYRTQAANRQAAVERFVEILRKALMRPKLRRKTRATYASKQRRLEGKRRRSDIKRQRSQRNF
jgi:ribosome-associated protein